MEQLADALRGRTSTKSDWESLLHELLAIGEAPAPDADVLSWFCSPEVLRELSEGLFVRFSRSLRGAVDRVAMPMEERDRGTTIRVRRLGPLGDYPNLDLDTRRGAYRIHAGIPYLITENSWREERRWSPNSELSSLTRHEVRIAAALACSERGIYRPYLSGTLHDFPAPVMAHVDRRDHYRFAVECLLLLERLRRESVHLENRAIRSPTASTTPSFYDFTERRQSVTRFARKFAVTDPLLLRTSKYLVKSGMLELVDGLEEDAFASLLFALEGCVLMLQRAHGIPTDKIRRRFLRKFLSETFAHGDVDYDYIEEAMGWGGVRANLIHPQLAHEEGWSPFLMAGDFFEYRRLVRSLLRLVVTGEHADWFDPADRTF